MFEYPKIKPECLKPGLNVMVDWYGGESQLLKGVVEKKLRKNWGVKVNFGLNDIRNCSVPYEILTIDIHYTKDGKPLLATKEDREIFNSDEHIEYLMSLVVEDNDKLKESLKRFMQ